MKLSEILKNYEAVYESFMPLWKGLPETEEKGKGRPVYQGGIPLGSITVPMEGKSPVTTTAARFYAENSAILILVIWRPGEMIS